MTELVKKALLSSTLAQVAAMERVDNAKGLIQAQTNCILLHCMAGKAPEVERLALQAVKKSEAVFGTENLTTANCLYNVAFILADQWRFEDAEKYHEHALHIRQKLLGNEHIEVARSKQALALVYINRSKFQEAEEMLKEALAIHKKTAGMSSLAIAAIYQNIFTSLRFWYFFSQKSEISG